MHVDHGIKLEETIFGIEVRALSSAGKPIPATVDEPKKTVKVIARTVSEHMIQDAVGIFRRRCNVCKQLIFVNPRICSDFEANLNFFQIWAANAF